VTEIPGTTRDLLTERVDIGGLALTLIDTAGLRDARDEIEAEGVRRAQQAQRIAALTMVAIDGSQALTTDDRTLVENATAPAVVIQTKSDLPLVWASADVESRHGRTVVVSAMTGAGLEELRQRIAAALLERDDLREPPAITNIRHLTLIEEARDAVRGALHALRAGATEELVLTDLARARDALEQVTGRRAPDDLLRHIFTRFCIGK
jgi:tRNA modification GTPase